MYDEETDAFVLSTSQPLAQGAQAMLSYGDKGNDELLQLFGFVEGPNPHDRFVAWLGVRVRRGLGLGLGLGGVRVRGRVRVRFKLALALTRFIAIGLADQLRAASASLF